MIMRYTPGKDYPFLLIGFNRNSYDDTRSVYTETGMYIPWSDKNKLVDLKVVMLNCRQHEKVPSVHVGLDGSKDHDGFVFIDHTTNELWHNQYPMASYGQLDDSADRRVYFAGEYRERGGVMHDAFHFIGNIYRGMSQIKSAPEAQWPLGEKKAAVSALQQHGNDVQALMEKALGKKLVMKQVKYHPAADGKEPVLMDWFEAVVEGDQDTESFEKGRGRRTLVDFEPIVV